MKQSHFPFSSTSSIFSSLPTDLVMFVSPQTLSFLSSHLWSYFYFSQILSALLFQFVIIFIKFSETDHDNTQALEGSTEQSTEMKSYTNQIVPENQPECDAAKFTTSNERSLKKKLRPKLYQVNFSKYGQRGDGISVLTAFHYYHTAPVVKFCYHTVGTSAWQTLPT